MVNRSAYMHQYYLDNPGKFVKKPGQNADFYVRNKEAENQRCSEYKSEHKDEISEYNRGYRADNLEHLLEKSRINNKTLKQKALNHESKVRRRRAKSVGESCTSIYALSNSKELVTCPYCAQPAMPGKRCVDHIEPISRGGAHEADNLVIACNPCNLRKNNKLVTEILEH